jgi:hypothetical protein
VLWFWGGIQGATTMNMASKPFSKRRKKRAASIAFVVCGSCGVAPQIASAGGVWIEPTYIMRSGLDPIGNAYVQVTPSTPNAVAGYTVPACAVNAGWQTAFNATTPAGQAFLSMAMSARLARTPVRLIGSGVCTVHPQVETISYLDILPQ